LNPDVYTIFLNILNFDKFLVKSFSNFASVGYSNDFLNLVKVILKSYCRFQKSNKIFFTVACWICDQNCIDIDHLEGINQIWTCVIISHILFFHWKNNKLHFFHSCLIDDLRLKFNKNIAKFVIVKSKSKTYMQKVLLWRSGEFCSALLNFKSIPHIPCMKFDWKLTIKIARPEYPNIFFIFIWYEVKTTSSRRAALMYIICTLICS